MTPNLESDEARAILHRALDYPYVSPHKSYLFADGEAEPLGDAPTAALARGTPVLAYGSSRAPEQLQRKFYGWRNIQIPVLRGKLRDWDVVYSAHYAHYGSIPATLYPRAGAEIECAVMWLSQQQLQKMHDTEALGRNYSFVRLDELDLEVDYYGKLTRVHSYVGIQGALNFDNGPVSVWEIDGEGRSFTQMSQREIQTVAMGWLAGDANLEDWIIQTVTCPITRKQRNKRLEEFGLHFDYPDMHWLEGQPKLD